MTYAQQHAALVEYLKAKTTQADWHGVSDAANDLRVLEAQELAREVYRFSDHTQSCQVGKTGNHDDCTCGYTNTVRGCGLDL
jgi:hypothetical protein